MNSNQQQEQPKVMPDSLRRLPDLRLQPHHLFIAHAAVLMREPLHQPVPAYPSLPGSFSRASASSAEEDHRARTPTPTKSQISGRRGRSHYPQRPLLQA
jgi:hypothetical protein